MPAHHDSKGRKMKRNENLHQDELIRHCALRVGSLEETRTPKIKAGSRRDGRQPQPGTITASRQWTVFRRIRWDSEMQ